jgi:aminopeptidase YwaD
MKSLNYLIVAILLLASAAVAQPRHELLDPKLRDLLRESLSGELAKEHVIQITRGNRVQGSRQYRDAANYVLAELRKYGFSEKDAYIESYKSDGKIAYQTWQSPSGWDMESAELRMVEPYDERIVGYPEIGMSLMTYSNPGDVTAELVWVGSGESDKDYEGKDVKGKFVLATGYGGNVHRLAVLKYGAKAVVCYLDDERSKYVPDMLQYTGMWPRTEELSKVTFGFNLTNRQGEKLRDILSSGDKVVLHGTVKGIGLEPYFMDVVVAHIRGSISSGDELVFSAHLDHPKESANDNASGSGAILDIARTLNELIKSGRMPVPKRSLTFLWVPEWNGTMAYIDRHPELQGPELGGKFLANLNMDMVGENLDLLHSHLYITRTPGSIPSVLNDVVENMAEMVLNMDVLTPRGSLSDFSYQIIPYVGGSDHMMFIDRKIPGIMFGHSDWTHHTSEDTPDKVDPAELERCEIISTGAMLYLANLNASQAEELAYIALANASQRLGLYAARSNRESSEYRTILDNALVFEKENMNSLLTYNSDESIKNLVEIFNQQLQSQRDKLISGMEAAHPTIVDPKRNMMKPDTRIPMRLTRGPLDFGLPESKLSKEEKEWYSKNPINGNVRFEIVNFVDGKKTVSDIRDAITAEYDAIDTSSIAHYLEDLVKCDVVKWR